MNYIYKNKTDESYIISKQWGNISHKAVSSFDIYLALKFKDSENNLYFYDLVYAEEYERISYENELKNIRKQKLLKLNRTR